MNLFSYLIILLLLTSCSNDNDFLFREKPNRPTLGYPEFQPLSERVVQVRQFNHLLRESGGVDILWVIDNSGSMSSYQNDVIRHTDKFMNEFTSAGRIDWRMGLISSDESEEPYLGFAQYNGSFLIIQIMILYELFNKPFRNLVLVVVIQKSFLDQV